MDGWMDEWINKLIWINDLQEDPQNAAHERNEDGQESEWETQKEAKRATFTHLPVVPVKK